MTDLRELDQDERNGILHRMVEGLHALIFGIYTIGSGDYALRALGDGGSIHEYVHGMLALLPERCYEQVKTSDMDTQALARREFTHAVAAGVPACDIPDNELPGMWERADFEGGQDEVRGPDWKRSDGVNGTSAPQPKAREVPPGKWRVDMPDGTYGRMPGDPPGPASVFAVIDGYVYNVEPRTGRLIASEPPTGFRLQKFNEEMKQRNAGVTEDENG